MPIESKIYKCVWGCKKRLMGKKAMERHEEICINNPDRKTCRTCAYNALSLTPDGTKFYCIDDRLPLEKKIVIDCKYWADVEYLKGIA